MASAVPDVIINFHGDWVLIDDNRQQRSLAYHLTDVLSIKKTINADNTSWTLSVAFRQTQETLNLLELSAANAELLYSQLVKT